MRLNEITRTIGRVGLQAKKNSPHIFFGVGLAGVVSGGVLACRATLRLEETLDDIRADKALINEHYENREEGGPEVDAEHKRLLLAVHVKGGLKVVKLYGPAIIVTGVGLACLTNSHVELTRRNAALQAALVTVQKAYDDYRDRVREEIGEEKEEVIFRNLDRLAESDAPMDRDPARFSPYARRYSKDTTAEWKPDGTQNRFFVDCQQRYMNHLLNTRGHVFLNEVYDALGMDRSKIGAIVGWLSDGDGDGYVDFDMFNDENILSADLFLNGLEHDIWLDFNVDGVIFPNI